MIIQYNPITGMLEGDIPPSDSYLDAVLFTDMPIAACVASVDYSAIQLNSNYNNNIVTRSTPIVDGVVLEAGRSGQRVNIARVKGMQYTFNQAVFDPTILTDNLYLDKNGLLSLVEPSISNGDRWYVYVGRRVNAYSFIFDPHPPLDLLNPGGIVPPSPYPDPSLDKLSLFEPMVALSCFKIMADGLAHNVKANDLNFPFIDGLTLEAGVANQEVKVARIKNQAYLTPFFFTSDQLYFLNNLGVIATPRDANAIYSCFVGRSIGNTNYFIFDPRPSIKLAR
jgi:hypothetical protein